MTDPKVEGGLEGVVVGTMDLGENDRLVRLLTAEEGRVAVVARGARTSARRYAGMTELGTRLLVVRGRGKGLRTMAQVDRLGGPLRARDEIERIGLLAYGAELCAALAPEGSAADKLYQLLVHWLALLEAPARPGPASRVALEAKALTFAGLAPALVICANCGGILSDPVVFDAEAGGGLHARCGGGRPLSVEDLHTFEHLRRTPLADTAPMEVRATAAWVLADFVQHQLGRPLTSRTWLATLG